MLTIPSIRYSAYKYATYKLKSNSNRVVALQNFIFKSLAYDKLSFPTKCAAYFGGWGGVSGFFVAKCVLWYLFKVLVFLFLEYFLQKTCVYLFQNL